ncbi:hypothetical protein BH10CYA1_BH10CYA1_34010 [soil metagenome]
MIEEKYLEQLRAAGLYVSHPIPAFRGGFWICKPVATPGNNIPGFNFSGYISLEPNPQCPDIDAPMLKFMFLNDCWQVHGQDCSGGLGPADFIDEWSTPSEAVEDILDFFFGEPARMNAKASERKKAALRAKAE